MAVAAGLAMMVAACGSTDAPETPAAGRSDTGTAATTSSTASPTTPTTIVPTTSTTIDPTARCIADLPVRQKVAQLMGIAVDGGALSAEATRVAELGVGVVLVQRPTSADLAQGIASVKAASAIPPLVAVDEEGGQVQRLRDVLGAIPSQRQVASTLDGNAAAVLIGDHARGVAGLGFDVVFGPVVDVALPGGGGPLGDRTFSDDPETVAAYGRVYADALEAAGLLPVLKHFPGHGSGEADSHDGPVGTPPIEELRRRDLRPFEALSGDDDIGVMVGHLNVPGLTGTTPASLSSEAIAGLLRGELGFDGLVFSDSLSMGAIAGTIPPEQAAVRAIAAGADVALFVSIANPSGVIDALEAAVEDGALPIERVDESTRRVLARKAVDPCAL